MANNDIEKALGLPILVTGFGDGVDRLFYPFKMKEIHEFFEILFNIPDYKKLMITMLYKDGQERLEQLFAYCFKDNPIEEFGDAINIRNYESIMRQIFDCCGLDFPDDIKDTANPQQGV